MGTESFRLFFIFLFSSIIADNFINVERQKIILSSLFTHSCYPSINFALKQIATKQIDIELELNGTEDVIPCDVGTSVKVFFDIINQTTSLSVLMTDACQNVLSYIAEVATYFHLPVFSFTDSDLSLSSVDRYPLIYHMVPSDRAHNLVRKQLLQYFNWTRFGLIYQHGSKYTLVANDFSDLTAMDKNQWEVNLTRGIPYRYGPEWYDDNIINIKTLLKDFKTKDVRIIIANLNQTLATHMFCHAAREHVYGSSFQWIMLGYPSVSAWWTEKTDCSIQEIIRAINGTFQTRVPRLSIDDVDDRPDHVLEYLKSFSDLEKNYFDAYAYDTIWSLAYIYQSKILFNQSNIKKIVDKIDFIGATGRVRYLNSGRIGEILVEQYVACRMMSDGSCKIPCYEEDKDCSLTVVKIFLAKNSDSKYGPPVLHKLNSAIWHGNNPTRDRTNQIIQYEHIYLSVFISITIISGIGLIISISLFIFNIRCRSHRYIRMSSPSLNNIILCGCMLAYISIILMGVNSSLFPQKWFTKIIMNIICATRMWLLCISFTLAFGSMFSKTWRVHSIFTNINLTRRAIHDSRLLAVVGALLCIDLFYLIAWQIFDPIQRKYIYDTPYRPKYNQDIQINPYYEVCQGEYTAAWLLILILYKGLLMFYGSFLSWKTRHVTIPALNDSRYIGLSVYIVFICCTLGSLVTFIPSEQIQLSYCLTSLFIVICTTATVGLVFVPKIIEVYRDPHAKRRQIKMIRRLQTNPSRSMKLTSKHLNSAILDNNQLNFVFSMQEQTLERLMEQLKNSSTKNNIIRVPYEFERLISSENNIEEEEEDEEEEEEDDDDDEEENPTTHDDDDDNINDRFLSNNKPFKGRVARALSLCLYNKIHMAQVCWSETSGGVSHGSISQLQDNQRSPSMTLLKSSYHKSADFVKIEESQEQTSNLVETISLSDIEPVYDGLISLDDIRLDKMIETDLISSNF
ncbi:unnamed protein product [Adineta steineri]|uniref:G-protein coupled receptors family 3 profile domain-containing protein n=2 Tax=Adineta steineri TaxID=433720 RepID=A0A815LMS4_9BILA|nr:unnamed protein product [Adineta steineri]CAF3801468.1 unnamed protein product [Adineta steineri]